MSDTDSTPTSSDVARVAEQLTAARAYGTSDWTQWSAAAAAASAAAVAPDAPMTAARAAMDHLQRDTDEHDSFAHSGAEGAVGGGGDGLRRVRLEPFRAQFAAEDVDAADAMRPPYMAPLERGDVTAMMRWEQERIMRRDAVVRDRRVQFATMVADLSGISKERLNVSSAQFAAAPRVGMRPPTTALPVGLAVPATPLHVPLDTGARVGAALGTGEAEAFAEAARAPLGPMGIGAAPGQPARTDVSSLNPVDMLFNPNPAVRALGDRVHRAEALRASAAYMLRIETTGLLDINSVIHSHAMVAHSEVVARHGATMRHATMMDLVWSDAVWVRFAQLVAAKINMTEGGNAPRRDVLQVQYRRNVDVYRTMLKALDGAVYCGRATPQATRIQLRDTSFDRSARQHRRRVGAADGGHPYMMTQGYAGGDGGDPFPMRVGIPATFRTEGEMHHYLHAQQSPPVPLSAFGPVRR